MRGKIPAAASKERGDMKGKIPAVASTIITTITASKRRGQVSGILTAATASRKGR